MFAIKGAAFFTGIDDRHFTCSEMLVMVFGSPLDLPGSRLKFRGVNRPDLSRGKRAIHMNPCRELSELCPRAFGAHAGTGY